MRRIVKSRNFDHFELLLLFLLRLSFCFISSSSGGLLVDTSMALASMESAERVKRFSPIKEECEGLLQDWQYPGLEPPRMRPQCGTDASYALQSQQCTW